MKRFKFFHKKQKSPTLYDYMEREGLKTQQELADRLGVTQAHVSYFLSGKHHFGTKTALRIHKLTGVSIEYLITTRKHTK